MAPQQRRRRPHEAAPYRSPFPHVYAPPSASPGEEAEALEAADEAEFDGGRLSAEEVRQADREGAEFDALFRELPVDAFDDEEPEPDPDGLDLHAASTRPRDPIDLEILFAGTDDEDDD